MFASVGEPFIVSRIADDIEIRFVVPVNQEPPFESMNANLTGSAVKQNGNLRTVESEVKVVYPIDTTNIGQAQFANPQNLSVGSTYRASDEIPLAPELNPTDPVAAIASIRSLDQGEEFIVLEQGRRNNTPWYRVQTSLGEGWINSTALIGQEIMIVR